MSFREYVGRIGRIKIMFRNKMLDVIRIAELNKYLIAMEDVSKKFVEVKCPYAGIKGTTVLDALDLYSPDSEVCRECGNYLICDDLIKRKESGKVEKAKVISFIPPSAIIEN